MNPSRDRCPTCRLLGDPVYCQYCGHTVRDFLNLLAIPWVPHAVERVGGSITVVRAKYVGEQIFHLGEPWPGTERTVASVRARRAAIQRAYHDGVDAYWDELGLHPSPPHDPVEETRTRRGAARARGNDAELIDAWVKRLE